MLIRSRLRLRLELVTSGPHLRARQPIADLIETTNADGKPACGIVLEPGLIRTQLEPFRPFQGWRYPAAGGMEITRTPAPPGNA